MVDEEIQDVPAQPTGAPVNRDPRRDPDVIEGEIAAREIEEGKSPSDSTEPETNAGPPPAKAASGGRGRGLLAGAVGGVDRFCARARGWLHALGPQIRPAGRREPIERA